MATRNFYIDEIADEVMPCRPTLEAWAEWLSEPHPDWNFHGCEAGRTFKCFTLDVLGDIRAEWKDGAWVTSPIPEGTEVYYLRHYEDSEGWDADYSSDELDSALDGLQGQDDPLFLACTKAGPTMIVRYAEAPPRLEIVEGQA